MTRGIFPPDVWRGLQSLDDRLRAIERLTQNTSEKLMLLGNKSFVTTLPDQPNDGDVIYYLADATKGVIWPFRYRAFQADGTTPNPSPYKWEFIGSAPLWDEVTPQESTASTIYAVLTTAGPQVTAPLVGDYLVTIRADGFNSAGGFGTMSYTIAGASAVDADGIFLSSAGLEGDGNTRTRLKTFTAASTALVAVYKTSANAHNFRQRWMSIVPVRVG